MSKSLSATASRLALGVALLLLPAVAVAQQPGMAPVPAAPVPTLPAAPAPVPVLPPADGVRPSVPGEQIIPGAPVLIPNTREVPRRGGDALDAGVTGNEEGGGAERSAERLVKRLEDPSTTVSLDELATAQQALARLDLLLQIEQKRTEIDAARRKRTNDTNKAAGPQMASNPGGMPQLIPTVQPLQPPPPVLAVPKPATPTRQEDNYAIERVYGAGGQYTAVLNDGSKHVMAHKGDELPDGSIVSVVTMAGVQVKGPNGEARSLPFSQGASASPSSLSRSSGGPR